MILVPGTIGTKEDHTVSYSMYLSIGFHGRMSDDMGLDLKMFKKMLM